MSTLKPEVSVSSSCGPKSGVNVSIKANGFAADDVASWELKDSDGKTRLNGYFHTDSDGNVNDRTAIEDVEKEITKFILATTQTMMEG